MTLRSTPRRRLRGLVAVAGVQAADAPWRDHADHAAAVLPDAGGLAEARCARPAHVERRGRDREGAIDSKVALDIKLTPTPPCTLIFISDSP